MIPPETVMHAIDMNRDVTKFSEDNQLYKKRLNNFPLFGTPLICICGIDILAIKIV